MPAIASGLSGSNRWLAAICLTALGALPFDAIAQTTEPLLPIPPAPSGPQAPVVPGQPTYAGETVTQRVRPEVYPIGLHFDDYFWFPRGELDEAYNSNIFAIPSPTGDLITTFAPSFDLLSSFPRNSLNLHGGAALQDYALHSSQNTASGFGSVDGRLNINATSSFVGSGEVAHLYQPRTSPNSPGNAAEPVTYNNYTANLGYAQTGLRLGYEADLGVQSAKYNPVPAIGGGILPEDVQNVTNYEASLRVSYEIIPDYEGYIRTSGTLYDYQHIPPGSITSNSTVYRADLGLRVLPRHIIYGDVYFGYLRQVFTASALPSTSTPDGGGRLIWNVTRLTTLTFDGIRSFQTSNPSVGFTGAGYLSTVLTATVDHELWRDLLFSANAAHENDAFQGISRNDDIITGVVGFKYLLNRNLYFGLSYTYQQRASSGSSAGLPYAQSIVMLRVSTQF